MNMKNKQTFGTVIALIGGTCWGFSGCCGQYLFEQKGANAPWLVALRLLFAGLLMIGAGFVINGRGNVRIFKQWSKSD